MSAYGDDLAYTHDRGFGAVAEAGAALLVELLRRRGTSSARVVELGCGSGTSSRILSEAGHRVTGIDASPAMVAIARVHAPAATFAVGSFVDADLPPCDAVTAFGEVLGYLFDPRHSGDALAALFRRVHAALAPGGLFVLDLAAPTGRADRGWSAGEDWAVLYAAEEDSETAILTRRIVTFRRVGDAWRRCEETHHQQLMPPARVAALLRAAGFHVRVRRGYGAYRLRPEVRAFVAVKP